MRILPFIILLSFVPWLGFCQSPHEKSLEYDCSFCHQASDWKVNPSRIEFSHDKTSFSLAGQHAAVSCRSCHSNLKFSGTPQNCYSCHKDVHMSTVGFECSGCHTPESWTIKDINGLHQQSRFPLTGAHIQTDCSNCHSGYSKLVFNVEGIRCYDCHRQDYLNTINPNHPSAGFSTDCQDCHSLNSYRWSVANFSHDFFPLTGGHKISSCFSCHINGSFNGLSKECYSCHRTNYEGTTDPNHLQAGFPTDCSQCHKITTWNDAVYDHNLSGFPLTGAHINVSCISCHSSGYSGISDQCVSCHQNDYNAAPDHAVKQYPQDCKLCHNTTAWNQTNFNHSNTQFPLTGVHLSAQCSSCHASGFSGTPKECISCHQQDYNNSVNPGHTALAIPVTCQDCHTVNPNWEPALFPIHNNYYVITGAHLQINNCVSCHNGNYNSTPNTCFGCHAADYNNTTNPAHASAGFPTECVSCHTQDAWKPSTFDHDGPYFPIYSGRHAGTWTLCSDCHRIPTNFASFSCIDCHEHNKADTDSKHQGVSGYVYASAQCYACHPRGETSGAFDHSLSGFPLTGAHTNVNCLQCHQNGYSGTSTICRDCHQPDFNNTANPNHQALAISTECNSCHTTNSGWKPALFPQHDQFFVFTGAHLQISQNCSQCHQGNYNLVNTQCLTCHADNYNSAQNPNHQAAGISTQCSSCHTTTVWLPSVFNHVSTGFELSGQHLQIQCSACHQGTTSGLNPACVSCHVNDFNNAQNPNHQAAGIPNQCGNCHTAAAWIPSTFDHTSTGFQLTGQHLVIQCSSCHEGTVTGLSSTCISCHQDNYNNAPNHASQNYPVECQMCHNATAWNQTTFNHTNTIFPLTGAHINVSCASCHQNGFAGTTTVCVNCHQAAYNNSTNPSHTALQLSTDCTTCHTTNPDWQPATFPIHANYYPLLGAHALIQNCASCHNGNYNQTPNTCFGCHENDYNGTTNPAHAPAGFSHECQTCHTLNGWTPSTFNHTPYFPIYSGRHAGTWTLCSTCHTNPANYEVFSCITCHEHNQTLMNEQHQGISGYVYESTACYNCHPTGSSKIIPNLKELNNK